MSIGYYYIVAILITITMEKKNKYIRFIEAFPDEESCIKYFEEMR